MAFDYYDHDDDDSDITQSPGVKLLKRLQAITNDKKSIAGKKLARDLQCVESQRKMSLCIEEISNTLGFGPFKPQSANLEKAGSFRVQKRSDSILSSATRTMNGL